MRPCFKIFLSFCRYYGLRKISTPTVGRAGKTAAAGAAAAAAAAATHKKPQPPSVSKPIITVTEFTPGNTPDKVEKIHLVNHPLLH